MTIARCAATVVAAVVLALSTPATAGVERFAVVVGHNRGDGDEATLKYAEDDARKLAEVLEGVGGVPAENTVLLRGKGASDVRRSLIAVNERVRARAGSGRQTMLLVYYSGHADAQSLHLGGSHLEVEEIERLVRGSAASFRLLILDSCRSGALTRVKGGRSAPAIPVALDARLSGEGVVFLTSSSAREDAQESDDLKGSFFTHYLVSGLLGAADRNRDGRVVLREAYQHAFDQTVLASSRTVAGIQHPTFRYELAGQGDIVLSEVGSNKQRGLVHFPSGKTYVVARRDSGDVIAEVDSQARSRTLSLEPGGYFVRGRARSYLLEGDFTVVAGGTTRVADDSLERIEYARLVRKGGSERDLVHGPAVGYFLRSSVIDGGSPCQGPLVAYPIVLRHFSIAPRLAVCRGHFENQALAARTDALDLQVRLTHAWDLPHVTLDLGVVAGGELLREGFRDTRADAPDRWSGAGHLDVTAGAEIVVRRELYLAADLGAQSHFFRVRDLPLDENAPEPSHWTARFALSGAVLLGWRL